MIEVDMFISMTYLGLEPILLTPESVLLTTVQNFDKTTVSSLSK